MVAEKITEKIRRLAENREVIRNICTCAHIDHGKCVAPNTRILLANGEIKTAAELFDLALKYGDKFYENQNYIIYDLSRLNLKIFSLNKTNGKIEKIPIFLAWKLKGGKLIEIKLKNGFKIATTPEHKFLVLENFDFVEKTAEEINIGDRLVCGRKLETESDMDLKEAILKALTKKRFYVKLKKGFGKRLKKILLKIRLKKIIKKIKTKKSFYYGICQRRYLIKDLLKISKVLKLDLNKIYDQIKFIKFGKRNKPIRLPNNFEDLFYLAGLFLGNEKFEKIRSETFAQFLNCLFDLSLKNKSQIKISNLVKRSPKNYVAKLIQGYFDSDAVKKSEFGITISANKQMISDLSLTLLRFGCVPIIKNDNAIILSAKSAHYFSLEAGENLISVSAGSYIVDFLQNKLASGDLAFIEVRSKKEIHSDFVYDFTIPKNHNFIAEGIVIHNTTFSDNLLFGSGMISPELAAKALVLDFAEDEKARGVTIDAAAVSMIHNVEGKDYLINLIDTPGHIDFGGDVTRAMRAIDGAILLVDAVEGVMPQTETVLRQAMREKIKPILYINKVDRLITQQKLTPEKIQQRFIDIINSVNKLIYSFAPKEFKEAWQVSVSAGSVAFGSAYHKWALSLPYMEKTGITFKHIIEAYEQAATPEEGGKALNKIAPLHTVILDLVVRHLPNPIQAQKYRIPHLWHGDLESETGKALLNCDPKGAMFFCPTKIIVDPLAGEIAIGRIFSGAIKRGMEVWCSKQKAFKRIQQLYLIYGAKREVIDNLPCGNVVGVSGLDTSAGETISEVKEEPFVEIVHIFEPVVTKSIEVVKPADLPKLIEVLKKYVKKDPTLKVEINEETGEHLISGMGEFHLEIVEERIRREEGLAIKASPPIVVYREAITKPGPVCEGKSPNKHNKFYLKVEPLDEATAEAIRKGEIEERRIRKRDLELRDKLVALGWDSKKADGVKCIFKGNVFVDETRGIVQIGEVIEMVTDMFEEVMAHSPIAKEPAIKMRVALVDCKLHEDAIHRGPAQVYPAVREAIRDSILGAGPVLYEPFQIHQIEAPAEYIGELTKLVANKRGQLLEMTQEENRVIIKAKLPVAEMFGWASALRSVTGGRGFSSLVDQMYERMAPELQEKVIRQIRERKGLIEKR